MAASIFLIPRNINIAREIINSIDQYILTQGLYSICENPKVYFTEKVIPPATIRTIINTIRGSKNFKQAFSKIYSTVRMDVNT